MKEKINFPYKEISFDTSGASYTRYPIIRSEIKGIINNAINIMVEIEIVEQI